MFGIGPHVAQRATKLPMSKSIEKKKKNYPEQVFNILSSVYNLAIL